MNASIPLEKIDLYRTESPLKVPYQLAYGPVSTLQSICCRITLEDGRVGWGESTPLPGYSEANADQVWASSQSLARQWLVSRMPDVEAACKGDGFLSTALVSAWEDASGFIPAITGEVPLVGLAQQNPGEEPAGVLARVRAEGYRSFKTKVGYTDTAREMKRLLDFQEALLPGERLRVDANQGLSEDQAIKLLDVCNPAKIEFFEQPLPVSDVDATARLTRDFPVSILLDESITDQDSITRAARAGAGNAVKLKWMKQFGWNFLVRCVEVARSFGFPVVFGNGVAGPMNNRQESVFWLTNLSEMGLASESNGFLKLTALSTECGLKVRDGRAVVTAASLEISSDYHILEECNIGE
ncbi:MAG: hypothetical protein K8S54_13665 [Spirochaetia bacterium]|nr:hypothetical protein [Spirochaetia bacterium]